MIEVTNEEEREIIAKKTKKEIDEFIRKSLDFFIRKNMSNQYAFSCITSLLCTILANNCDKKEANIIKRKIIKFIDETINNIEEG